MQFSDTHYSPEVLKVLSDAFEDAWTEIQLTLREKDDFLTTRQMMALRIMAAAHEGVRDRGELKALAIRAVDGRACVARVGPSSPVGPRLQGICTSQDQLAVL